MINKTLTEQDATILITKRLYIKEDIKR